MNFSDFTVKETGTRRDGNYALYENEENLLLLWRDQTWEGDMSEALNYMPKEAYENMSKVLDEKSGVVAYVSQIEGTTSDVVLLDRKDINTAADAFKALGDIDNSRKFVDVTSSAEMENSDDFAAAIANMPASDDSLSR